MSPRKLDEIGKNIEDARRNRDPKLIAELERLAAEVKTANRLKTERQDASTRAQSARDRAEGAYDDYMLSRLPWAWMVFRRSSPSSCDSRSGAK